MNSQSAYDMDLPHHEIRWNGPMHLLSSFQAEGGLPKGPVWNSNIMFWIGFVYRFWHSLTDQYSKDIYSIVDADLMLGLYPKFHMDNPKATVDAILTGRVRPDLQPVPGFEPAP